jgi:hypothetical protein
VLHMGLIIGVTERLVSHLSVVTLVVQKKMDSSCLIISSLYKSVENGVLTNIYIKFYKIIEKFNFLI